MKKLHARKLSLTIAFVEKFVKRNQKASIAYSLVISKYGPQTQEFKTGFHKLYNDGVSHLRNIKRFRIEPIKDSISSQIATGEPQNRYFEQRLSVVGLCGRTFRRLQSKSSNFPTYISCKKEGMSSLKPFDLPECIECISRINEALYAKLKTLEATKNKAIRPKKTR